jgi:6-pyruvoyl-tetrahydropterin synthase
MPTLVFPPIQRPGQVIDIQHLLVLPSEPTDARVPTAESVFFSCQAHDWATGGDMKTHSIVRQIVFLALLLPIGCTIASIGQPALAAAGIGDPHLASTSADSRGQQIDEITIAGKPPDIKATPADVPLPDVAMGINVLSNVPAFDWSYGCSATSAAMLFGYYDLTGYSNMYAGPTNEGVCPLDNSVWGPGIGGSTAECPLSATHEGVDGRMSWGHVDDYWISYNSRRRDPYIQNGWQEHTQGDCTGDFMGTNQSKYSNVDGATTFYSYTNGDPLYDYTGAEPTRIDGCHGLKDFAVSRGYGVMTNFTQYIKGQGSDTTKGFTFEDFMSEIDAGRPVLIQVEGHTMVGYGYSTTGNVVYVHDTWDYSDHQMTWGGTYSGLQHYGVTVMQLSSSIAPTVTTGVANNISENSATLNGNLSSLGSASSVVFSFEWGPTTSYGNGTTPHSASGTGAFNGEVTGLSSALTYHFRAKAVGDGTVYGDDMTFNTVDTTAPGQPTLLSPGSWERIDHSYTLDWDNVTDDASNPVTYDLQLWSFDWTQMALSKSGLTTSDCNLSYEDLDDETYWWIVRAVDGAGNVGEWAFGGPFILVSDTIAPGQPTLSSPGSWEKIDHSYTMDWTDVTDDASNPVTHDLLLFNFDWTEMALSKSGLTTSDCNLSSETLADGTYWWIVRAVDGAGNVGEWAFGGPFILAPNQPTLLSPGIWETINPTYTLDWTDVTDPSGMTYELQVFNFDWTEMVVSESALTTSDYNLSSEELDDGTYWWIVRAVDGAGYVGEWAFGGPFIMDNSLP